jgi:hypothetical protein
MEWVNIAIIQSLLSNVMLKWCFKWRRR